MNRSRIGEAMSGKMNVRYGIMGTYMMMGDGRHVDLGVRVLTAGAGHCGTCLRDHWWHSREAVAITRVTVAAPRW